jgi:hypothetical protein
VILDDDVLAQKALQRAKSGTFAPRFGENLGRE